MKSSYDRAKMVSSSVISFIVITVLLATSIPISIGISYYQKYGSLRKAITSISRHQIIFDSGFKGHLTVCDDHGSCGNLEVVSQWKYSDLDLKEFLKTHYPIGSLVACYQYTHQPTVYSLSSVAIYEIPMMFAGVAMIPFPLFLLMAIMHYCNK